MDLKRFHKIAGYKPGRALEAEESGRKVTIIWQDPPGLYLVTATVGGQTGEEIGLSMEEAGTKANRFLDTGYLGSFRPEGIFSECHLLAEIKAETMRRTAAKAVIVRNP